MLSSKKSPSAVDFKVGKSPSAQAALQNFVYVHPEDVPRLAVTPPKSNTPTPFVLVKGFIFTFQPSPEVPKGFVAFNNMQRRCASLSLNETIACVPYFLDETANNFLSTITLEVDYLTRSQSEGNTFEVTTITQSIVRDLENQFLTLDQRFLLDINGINLQFRVLNLDVIRLSDKEKKKKEKSAGRGIFLSKTEVILSKAPNANLRLAGAATNSTTTIFRPDFNFTDMGIGGLDDEFSNIFRRAFASRVFPPHIVSKLGIKHVKGILLYGPPGTGKTLMARQIGKMLNGKEPKIVNGPEILNKYVGESEANIRRLFEDAEKDQTTNGDNSELHIIIFDEIDAICKARGTATGSTGVSDTVVNQLLSKIDGVNALNNILLIGMTNRKDLIDEALLRPGRLEVHMEIGLPDSTGRLQILRIHTNKMSSNGYLSPDVDLAELSSLTKNFTGAEIEGLVKSAASFAFNRQIDANNLLKPLDPEKIQITREDFMNSLREVTPAFGIAGNEFEGFVRNGIINFGQDFQKLMNTCKTFVQQVTNSSRTPLVSILLEGSVGCGKTALAATLAMESEFPFVKMITPEDMVAFSESAKSSKITKVFQDAYKSPLSVIVLDDIERLIEYVPIGPRLSNAILQVLLVLLKKVPTKGRKLLLIGTTSSLKVMEDMELKETFNAVLHVPNVKSGSEVAKTLKELNLCSDDEVNTVSRSIYQDIPIKKLLMIAEMARQGDQGTLAERFIQCVEDYTLNFGRT